MVQRHLQDVASSAHFLPLQGRQRGLDDGDGDGEVAEGTETLLGGGGVGVGREDGGGRVGGARVLDARGV